MPAVARCCTAADVCYLYREVAFTPRKWRTKAGISGFFICWCSCTWRKEAVATETWFPTQIGKSSWGDNLEMAPLKSLMDSCMLPANSRETASQDRLREKLTLGEDLTTGFSCLTGVGEAETDSSQPWEKRMWIEVAEWYSDFFPPVIGTRVQGSFVFSMLRDTQSLTRHSPEQPVLSWPHPLQWFGLETSQLHCHWGEH